LGWKETLDHVNRAVGRGAPESGELPAPFTAVAVADAARVDLSLPAPERWTQAAAARPGALATLIEAAEYLIAGFGGAASGAYHALSRLAYPFYRLFGNYIDEGLAMADAAGQSRVATTVLQRLYSFGYMAPGCSTCVIEEVASGAKRHFRSLDWPMVRAMRACAQLHEFYGAAHDARPRYRSAGMYGMLGLLSAAKPGFAVSINHAPLRFAATPRVDPLLLLRKVFDDAQIATYGEAVAALSGRDPGIGAPGAPVFYVVSGAGKGEACVIEWGSAGQGCRIRDIRQANATSAPGYRVLLQTNHYDNLPGTPSPLPNYGTEDALYGSSAGLQYLTPLKYSSMARRRALRTALDALLGTTRRLPGAAELLEIYSRAPLFTYESAQWVSLDPASGGLEMWVRGEASLNGFSAQTMQRCFAGR
jgi:hypothetical protein